MSKEEFLKIQTCVLKVNIHCDGCKRKVKKTLQKIDGVYKINIESDLGKVTVSGNLDPPTLIKKLSKNGKHAELWDSPKPNQNQIQNQFKNLQIDTGKGANGNNPTKGGQNGQKGGGDSVPQKVGLNNINPNQLEQLKQQMKSLQDMKFSQSKDEKMPMGLPIGNNNDKGGQNKKNVTFDLPDEEDDQSDGEEFDKDYDDDEDYDETDDDDDEMEESPITNALNKKKPMVGNEGKIPNMLGKIENVGGCGGQNGKKGGGGLGNKDSGGDGNGKNGQMQGGGKNGKGAGGEGKLGNIGGGGQNGNFNINGGKKGAGGISDGLQGLANLGGPGGVGQLSNMPMGPMGNGVQMGQVPAVQGLPATGLGSGGGAYLAGVGPEPLHHQQQQQQLAAMMMNQQRANGNERFQPMMYARPPPAVNYMPPYQYPYPYPYPYPPPGEPYAHTFNDENTSSCNVM